VCVHTTGVCAHHLCVCPSLVCLPITCVCGPFSNSLCFCTNSLCFCRCSAVSGGFYLQFRENTTAFINWHDTATVFEAKLEKILTVGNVTVTFTNDTDVSTVDGGHGSAKGICNTTYAEIEFMSELGDLPLLKVYGSTLAGKALYTTNSLIPKINITEVQAGTKENIECSGRGYCNEDIGMCTCDNGYYSSDGQGNVGSRGDCGFKYSETQAFLPLEEEG